MGVPLHPTGARSIARTRMRSCPRRPKRADRQAYKGQIAEAESAGREGSAVTSPARVAASPAERHGRERLRQRLAAESGPAPSRCRPLCRIAFPGDAPTGGAQ